MQTVPAVSRKSPHHALIESLSLKKISEKRTVTRMLSLSMGTTMLTCPCRMA